ncbi:MAG: Phosphatidylserine decarboxylase proenzyme [uncultured bacterium]|nr:MAG: Phosphatidylserine decarboxylase proenzyme [uncultured bacterium]
MTLVYAKIVFISRVLIEELCRVGVLRIIYDNSFVHFYELIILLMPKSFRVLVQYGCPQHLLSRLAGLIAECRWKWVKNCAIKLLINRHKVNVSEALLENLEDYPTFNSFFTRQLKLAVRPIAPGENCIISPVDGCISQIGHIKENSIFQAKKFYFNTTTLLGGSSELAELFENGYFATFYLAPKDYHRVHMPLAGTLRKTIYIPGKLFSVNYVTTQTIPNLFARNERLVCLFDTIAGPMVVILVGAMLVGSIQTVWPMPARSAKKRVTEEDYSYEIFLERSAELGCFKMGSTAIVLFAKDKINWLPTLKENGVVKMGQAVGEAK